MIELYTSNSPNGIKASIALEELGLAYEVTWIHSGTREDLTKPFRAISPAGKIPALVDRESDVALFESAAILLYLAEKTGRLLPTDPVARWDATAWLMLHSASIGPVFGQLIHFAAFAQTLQPVALARFVSEIDRCLRLLDERLHGREFLSGTYSVADIAHFSWVHAATIWGIPLSGFEQLTAWRERLLERPAVQRGLRVPAPLESVHLRWLMPR